MIFSLLFGLLAPVASAVAPQRAALAGEPPTPLSVKGVSAERTVAEFMDVCFRPDWDVGGNQKAVQASEFAYVQVHNNDDPNSFSWKSKRGYLVVNTNSMMSQCALSIGSIQSRTGEQVLAMLRPAIEAELGHSVQENDSRFYLEWTDPKSGYVGRITLAGASSAPSHALWYVYDKTAPGVREKLDALMSTQKPASE